MEEVVVVEKPETTLRDSLEQAMEGLTDTGEAKPSAVGSADTPPSKIGAPDKPRAPDGKFVPKEPKEAIAGEVQPSEIELPKPRAKPPSSWKKDYHADFEKLDPKVADYVLQREGEYAKGVSVYKSEFDRLKPLDEAIAPFLPALKANNMDPAKWISDLGQAHQTLATAAPEARLSMFLKLAKDYNVPVQQLFTRGQDGQIYYNPQVQAMPAAPQAPATPNFEALIDQKLAERQAVGEVQQFMSAKDESGNPRYPHYETVRETMAQLLEAGLADDVPSAYDAALRHPRHTDLYEAERQQREAADKAAAAQKAKEEAERARRQQVSVKGKTPLGKTGNGKQDRRSQIESAFDAEIGGRA